MEITAEKLGIIYCRVSSLDQVNGTSLEGQKMACLEYATRNKVKVLKTFIEKGESATAINRTELIKALDFCKTNKGKIQEFIVWKVDRFARNTTDHFALRASLSNYGTTLHSVTEPIGSDPIGKMTETMLAGYAQFENDLRKQRCEGGMQRKIKDGIRPWHPPLGYTHSKRLHDRRKTRPDEPDSERFPLIQRGLKLYLKGEHNIKELTDVLREWGLRAYRGGPIFPQRVERILKDKFYAGILVDPWTKEEHRGLHKPMITLEEYHRIQVIKGGYSNRTTMPRTALHPDFPLRGFVACACGKKYTASWRTGRSGRKYPYYHCNNSECEHYTHAVLKSDMEDAFFDILQEVAPKKKFLKLFKAIVLETWNDRNQTRKDQSQYARKEMERLVSRRERLVQMRINGDISQEEFSSLKEALDNQIGSLNLVEDEIEIGQEEFESLFERVLQCLEELPYEWKRTPDVNKKQRLQRLVFIDGVMYHKSTGTFGTAVLAGIFKLNQEFDGNREHLVAGVGVEPTIPRL